MVLEAVEEGEEDGQRQLKDLRHRTDPVLGQGHAEVLLDGVDEHVVGAKDWARVLQDGEKQLQGQDFAAEFVRPESKTSLF